MASFSDLEFITHDSAYKSIRRVLYDKKGSFLCMFKTQIKLENKPIEEEKTLLEPNRKERILLEPEKLLKRSESLKGLSDIFISADEDNDEQLDIFISADEDNDEQLDIFISADEDNDKQLDIFISADEDNNEQLDVFFSFEDTNE